MPRQRFAKLPSDRQATIIETAGREFAARGFEGASLNQVLRDAGVSKGAAYYYFEDKLDLYLAVLHHYWDRMMAASAPDLELSTAATFWKDVAGAYRSMLSKCIESPWILGLAWSVWRLPPDVRSDARVQPIFDLLHGWYRKLATRGRQIGVIRTDVPETLVIQLLATLDEANGNWLRDHWNDFGDPASDAGEMHERMFAMVRGMFAPETAAAGDGDPR